MKEVYILGARIYIFSPTDCVSMDVYRRPFRICDKHQNLMCWPIYVKCYKVNAMYWHHLFFAYSVVLHAPLSSSDFFKIIFL